jgi:circadian clock protein KaiB
MNTAHGAVIDGAAGEDFWSLRLYVAGQSPRSLQAITNLNKLCEDHLAGHYQVEIIDLVDDPSRAQTDEIVAIPTLIRRLPSPIRRVFGDLSDTQRALVGLHLTTAQADVPAA